MLGRDSVAIALPRWTVSRARSVRPAVRRWDVSRARASWRPSASAAPWPRVASTASSSAVLDAHAGLPGRASATSRPRAAASRGRSCTYLVPCATFACERDLHVQRRRTSRAPASATPGRPASVLATTGRRARSPREPPAACSAAISASSARIRAPARASPTYDSCQCVGGRTADEQTPLRVHFAVRLTRRRCERAPDASTPDARPADATHPPTRSRPTTPRRRPVVPRRRRARAARPSRGAKPDLNASRTERDRRARRRGEEPYSVRRRPPTAGLRADRSVMGCVQPRRRRGARTR